MAKAGNSSRKSRRGDGARVGRPGKEGLEELTAQPHGSESETEAGELELLDLMQTSIRLRALHGAESFDDVDSRRLRARSVVAGERLVPGEGGLKGIETAQLQVGRCMKRMEDGTFQAESYGYLGVYEDRLEVISPLWVDPAKMAVYWLLIDAQARPVTVDMIMYCLGERRVVEGICKKTIETMVSQIGLGVHECGSPLIALGREAVEGQDALIQLLVEVEAEVEQRCRDAEVAMVKVREVIARRRLATTGVEGYDVYGRRLEAGDGRDRLLRAGENVETERKGGVELFRATAAGLAHLDEDTISVVRVLTVDSSVDFDTGNLDFDGRIHITGSVAKGFSVKAEGDVYIAGSVDPGALVQARGDVEIGRGIVGARTRVVAGGSVRARFVEEGTVMANGDILLGEFASQAVLVAGGQVRIDRGDGQNGGSLMGGEAWGRKGVTLHSVGRRGGPSVTLAAGLVPKQGKKLDELKDGLNTSYNQLVRCLERFGMTRPDLVQIQNMISAASGPRRKLLLSTAQRLTKVIRLYKNLAKAQKGLREQIETDVQQAEIAILEKIFPGVVIRIGEQAEEQQRPKEGPLHFRLVDGKLVDGRDGEEEQREE